MNAYAAILFFSCVAALVLGTAVIVRDRSNALNRVFLTLCVVLAAILYVSLGMSIARSRAEAYLWWRANFVWPFVYPLFLHFVLVYTEQERWLKKKTTYGILYLPSAIASLIELFTGRISGAPIETPWGWTYNAPHRDLLTVTVVCWNFILSAVAVARAVQFCVSASNPQKRRQSLFIAAGVTLPVLVGIGTDLLLPSFGIRFPELGKPSSLVTNALFAVAIWRHQAFELTPRDAADGILATMHDAVILVNATGEVAAANSAAARLLGRDHVELRGLSFRMLLGETAAEVVPWSIQEAVLRRATGEADTEVPTQTGRRVPVMLSWSVLRDAAQRPAGMVYLLRNISQRKDAEAELDRYRQHLDELVDTRTAQLRATDEQIRNVQKMEALGQLAGGVAHDFNNLLMVILGSVELARHSPDAVAMESRLNEIEKASLRAADVVRQLMTFSRSPEISIKPADARSVFDEVVAIVTETFDRRIEIQAHHGRFLHPILADSTRIHQVLLNLCVNARDALDHVGTALPPTRLRIALEVRNAHISPAQCRRNTEARPGHYVRFSIADTGIGMDEKTKQRVFEPFFSTKDPSKGTGLGLATVHGIVKQHGGWIEVESTPGHGSVFSVFIPAAPVDADLSDDELPPPRSSGHETILVIDDETLILDVATAMLEGLGYTALTAEDGLQGLQIYRERQAEVSATILDLSMPHLSGREVLMQIRKLDRKAPVIIASGYALDDPVEELRSLGAAAFLTKPYTVFELAGTLRGVLNTAAPNDVSA